MAFIGLSLGVIIVILLIVLIILMVRRKDSRSKVQDDSTTRDSGGGSSETQRSLSKGHSGKDYMASSANLRGLKYDAFLTHDWGEDAQGRSNHERVKQVKDALDANGIKCWFDEERMSGEINKKMTAGIDDSATVVVFITSRYIMKANGDGPNGSNDNCKFEFDYGLMRKGVEKMITVVMEPACHKTSDWTGTVGGKLGGLLYTDLSGDLAGPQFENNIKTLIANIKRKSAGASRPGSGHPQPQVSALPIAQPELPVAQPITEAQLPVAQPVT